MGSVKKKQTKVNMTWTPTVEDRKLMEELRAKTGIQADSELLRMGLRVLAHNFGVVAA